MDIEIDDRYRESELLAKYWTRAVSDSTQRWPDVVELAGAILPEDIRYHDEASHNLYCVKSSMVKLVEQSILMQSDGRTALEWLGFSMDPEDTMPIDPLQQMILDGDEAMMVRTVAGPVDCVLAVMDPNVPSHFHDPYEMVLIISDDGYQFAMETAAGFAQTVELAFDGPGWIEPDEAIERDLQERLGTDVVAELRSLRGRVEFLETMLGQKFQGGDDHR